MTQQTVAVFGGGGLVGSRFAELTGDDLTLLAPARGQVDVLDLAAVTEFVQATPAEVVLNLAAWTDLDGAEPQRGDTSGVVYRTNALLVKRLAEVCGELGKHLVHVSTDYVFDGQRAERPYVESDEANPLSWYGQTKREGELFGMAAGASITIARIEMPFTARPHRKSDFPRLLLSRLCAGSEIAAVVDQRITPVLLDDAVCALSVLVKERLPGIVHVASTDWTTPFDFATSIAQRLSLDASLIQPAAFDRFAGTRVAPRPRHSWLDVGAFRRLIGDGILRSVDAQVQAFVDQVRA